MAPTEETVSPRVRESRSNALGDPGLDFVDQWSYSDDQTSQTLYTRRLSSSRLHSPSRCGIQSTTAKTMSDNKKEPELQLIVYRG